MPKEFPTDLSAMEKLSRVFDDKADALNTIAQGHHEIHEGDHYGIEVTASLNAAQAIEILFTTPASGGKELHLTWSAFSAGGAHIELHEAVGYTSGGTAATPVNNNRNSTNTSAATGARTGTPAGALVYTAGTIIHGPQYLSSGQIASGGDRRENEFVLKYNTTYVLRVVSDVASIRCWLEAMWYEHTPSNLQAVS